jgi:hypothetical protein
LILRGLTDEMAAAISNRFEPLLNSLQRGKTMQVELMGGANRATVQARIAATYPKYPVSSYTNYAAVDTAMRKLPNGSDDEVFTEASKNFIMASAGGNLVKPQPQIDKETTRRYLLFGGVAAAIVLFVVLKKKRRR